MHKTKQALLPKVQSTCNSAYILRQERAVNRKTRAASAARPARTPGSPVRMAPSALVALRVALGPALYLLTAHGATASALLAVLAAGLLSDILDGVIARRLSVATERLRVADSYADGWYYGWVAAAAWKSAPDAIWAMRRPIAFLAAVMLCNYAFDFARYGRLSSFHAWSAKIWGLTLFVAAAGLLAYHGGTPFLWPPVVAGLYTNVEGFAMKLLLPQWEHDVPSVFHILRRLGGNRPQSRG